ncbi:MAG TPA: rhomboid family intramembrane serine protease [Allosphingosinicella sp.]|nr:rhomboid family intramembrane serine protease [Allosphingosinicella sp.]
MRPPQSWRRARLTLAIAVVTAVAFLVIDVLNYEEWATIWGGFIPARLAFGQDEAWAPFWLTPLTATLVHADWLHLALNLLILIFCGRPTEAALGPWGLGILYLIGAYAAAGAQYALAPTAAIPMVGASGAISAVLGAYAILFGRNKVTLANQRLAMWLNALWLMAAWIVLQVIVGLTLAREGILIAVGAHAGGFVAGVLLANPLLLLRYRKA